MGTMAIADKCAPVSPALCGLVAPHESVSRSSRRRARLRRTAVLKSKAFSEALLKEMQAGGCKHTTYNEYATCMMVPQGTMWSYATGCVDSAGDEGESMLAALVQSGDESAVSTQLREVGEHFLTKSSLELDTGMVGKELGVIAAPVLEDSLVPDAVDEHQDIVNFFDKLLDALRSDELIRELYDYLAGELDLGSDAAHLDELANSPVGPGIGEDLEANEHQDIVNFFDKPLDALRSVSSPELKLDEVKQPFAVKAGEEKIDEDSDSGIEEPLVRPMQFGGVEGYAPVPCMSASALESKLDEVKQPFAAMFGKRIDEDSDLEVEEPLVHPRQLGGIEGSASGHCTSEPSLEGQILGPREQQQEQEATRALIAEYLQRQKHMLGGLISSWSESGEVPTSLDTDGMHHRGLQLAKDIETLLSTAHNALCSCELRSCLDQIREIQSSLDHLQTFVAAWNQHYREQWCDS